MRDVQREQLKFKLSNCSQRLLRSYDDVKLWNNKNRCLDPVIRKRLKNRVSHLNFRKCKNATESENRNQLKLNLIKYAEKSEGNKKRSIKTIET